MPAAESEARALSLVILAAGASSRLGSCKALVSLGAGPEDTPLGRLLTAGRSLQPQRVLIVSGKHHASIQSYRDQHAPWAGLIQHSNWQAGRTLGLYLAHLEAPEHDLCVSPVDVPLVSAEVFEALARAWREAGSPGQGWLAPALWQAGSKRHGHPVILGRELLAQLRPDCGHLELRELRAAARPLWSIEVHDEGILEDLDLPEDLARMRARLAKQRQA